MGVLGYVRTLGIAGKSGKVGVLLPYAFMSADGYLNGNYLTREQEGLVDPAFYFSINLYGYGVVHPIAVRPGNTRQHF